MNSSDVREPIAVLFGGRSVEHEISIITGLELIQALDVTRYKPVPVYISPEGKWYTGDALLEQSFYRGMPDCLKTLQEVVLLPIPDIKGLVKLRSHSFTLNAHSIIPVEVFIPAFHGQYGEDGCLQGLLEMADATYTSSEVLPSAVAMNKYFCKCILKAHDIPVLPSTVVHKNEMSEGLSVVRERVMSRQGLEKFPLFVKPCNLGSSVGIGVARDEAGLNSALAKVFKYDLAAIVEPCVTNIFEINVSVIDTGSPEASVVEIPASSSGVLTYEDKYMRGGGKKRGRTRAQGMASLARKIDPEELDADRKEKVREYARQAYKVLGCSGVVRFDFIVDADKDAVFFNELNPLPGSFAFYLWAKSKPQRLYTEVLNEIIARAKERRARKLALKSDLGFKALFR
jgi:D-alanine-D-alanine ligase